MTSPAEIRRVGYIGIGNIGEPIAANVVAAGFELMVHDLRDEPLARLRARGAEVAVSARRLGAHSELVEVSIAGDERIEAALLGPDGVLSGMQPGSNIALHSTMNPATVRRIGERAAAAQVSVLDAQVTGGKTGAVAKTLTYMVGGEAAVLERCRPVFNTSARRIFHMGPLGAGASTKLAQQMITVMNITAVAEGVRVAAAAGVELDKFFELLAMSTGQSYAATHWRDQLSMVDRELADGFYLGMKPALEMAHDLGIPVPSTALAQQLIRSALEGKARSRS
jgi:3-hydroxyisobutyrate dehydrogenase